MKQLLSGWIDPASSTKQARQAFMNISGDLIFHYRENLEEYQLFADSLSLMRQDLFTLASNTWGSEIAGALYDEFWDEALKRFLIAKSSIKDVDLSHEIKMRLKKFKSKNQ